MTEYLDFAKDVAREAGEIMLKYFKADVEHHFKEDKTIVTVADEEINDMVIKRVAEKFPDHTVLGEEASNQKDSEYAWICDPIDGTNPYARGIPVSTFSLALTKDGQPVVGVIFDPFTQSLYSAEKGRGADKNGEQINVSDKQLSHGAVINIDWWYEARYDTWAVAHQLAKDTEVYPLSIGSVVRASTLVASGKFEAAIFPGTFGKFMDIAAAKVIIEEAGGKVTDIEGNEQRYDRDINGAIVSNGISHQRIVDALSNFI